jgi:Tol biopolymer transport system component
MNWKHVCVSLLVALTLSLGNVLVTLAQDDNEPYYLYYSTVTGRGFCPQVNVMTLDGSIQIEDIAGYYPPVEPGYGDDPDRPCTSRFLPSPSRRWISVETDANRPENQGVTQSRVFLMDTETNEITQLTDNRSDNGQIQWSPIEDLLTFGVNGIMADYSGLAFYDPEQQTTRNIQLTTDAPLELGNIYTYAWSQDAQKIVMQTSLNSTPDNDASSSLVVFNTDGSGGQVLTSTATGNFYFSLRYQWTDEGLVANCEAAAYPDPNLSVCLIDPDTGERTVLYELPSGYYPNSSRINLYEVRLSPDGRYLLMVTSERHEENGQTATYYHVLMYDRETQTLET